MHSFANLDNRIKKRLFIGLLVISLVVLGVLLLAAWWLISRKGLFFNQVILALLTFSAVFFLILLGIGLIALIWSIWRSKTIPSLHAIMYAATKFLYPVALKLGKWFGLEEERIKNSYIQVSNQLVRTQVKDPVKKILILAPHCLQKTTCPHKITIDVNNCRDCGQCPVSGLRHLAKKYGVELVIVTGGTSARNILKKKRPDAVVAIACERDLTSGIRDVKGLPVIGVLNQRPEGPCCNTKVNLAKVEETIQFFQGG